MFPSDNYLSKDTKSYSSMDKSQASSSSSEGFLMGGLDNFRIIQPVNCSISPVGCEILRSRCLNDILWFIYLLIFKYTNIIMVVLNNKFKNIYLGVLEKIVQKAPFHLREHWSLQKVHLLKH